MDNLPRALRPATARGARWAPALGWDPFAISERGHCRAATGTLLRPLCRGEGTRGSGWSYSLHVTKHKRGLIPIARLVYEAHVEELPEGGCVIQTDPKRWDAKSLLALPPLATECPLSSFAPGPGAEAQSYMLRELAVQGGTAHRRDLGAALYGADTRRAARRAGQTTTWVGLGRELTVAPAPERDRPGRVLT